MLSDTHYDDIRQLWEDETRSEDLQDLDDLTLGKMASYLSKVRMALTETSAENAIQADLYVREIENLEFMIRDLLVLRRNKILKCAIAGERPIGAMTLAEEELYSRLRRGFAAHSEFLESVLVGWTEKSEPEKKPFAESDENIEYVIVRFTRKIDTPFLGLDERIYGPFEKEDVATIPTANARSWLRDGTVVRIVPENVEEKK